MKIAISSNEKNINGNISENFGRCPYFIFAEIEGKKIKIAQFVKNISLNQTTGAGIAAAKIVADNKANTLITGAVGPRALEVLKQFNIKIYKSSGLIKKALQDFMENKLEKLE